MFDIVLHCGKVVNASATQGGRVIIRCYRSTGKSIKSKRPLGQVFRLSSDNLARAYPYHSTGTILRKLKPSWLGKTAVRLVTPGNANNQSGGFVLAHLVADQKVRGSNPLGDTKRISGSNNRSRLLT